MGWGIRKLTVKNLAYAMDTSQENDFETLASASVSDNKTIIRLLEITLVKALQFDLAVTLRIGSSNGNQFKAEENSWPMHPSYSLRYDT